MGLISKGLFLVLFLTALVPSIAAGIGATSKTGNPSFLAVPLLVLGLSIVLSKKMGFFWGEGAIFYLPVVVISIAAVIVLIVGGNLFMAATVSFAMLFLIFVQGRIDQRSAASTNDETVLAFGGNIRWRLWFYTLILPPVSILFVFFFWQILVLDALEFVPLGFLCPLILAAFAKNMDVWTLPAHQFLIGSLGCVSFAFLYLPSDRAVSLAYYSALAIIVGLYVVGMWRNR